MTRNYFWLNAGEFWNACSLLPGEKKEVLAFNFGADRLFNLRQESCRVQTGDIALAYQAAPVSRMLAVGKISRTSADQTAPNATVYFTKIADIKNGLSEKELMSYGFNISALTGDTDRAMHMLPEEDYLRLLDIIEEKNPCLGESLSPGMEMPLADKLEAFDPEEAERRAKMAGTYYFGGRLFEFRCYSRNEIEALFFGEGLDYYNVVRYDGSIALIDQEEEYYYSWTDDDTFEFYDHMLYLHPVSRDAKFELISNLFTIVHVFHEEVKGMFEYLGVAELEIKDFRLLSAPKERDGVWQYGITTRGCLKQKQ